MSTISTTAKPRGFTLAWARGLLREPQRRELFFWWVLAWFALAVCALIRGYMDDLGMPVHGAGTEEAVFGSLPSAWLQNHVYTLSPAFFAWAVRAIHGSWFVVPWLVGLLVSWKRPERIGSFFLFWITLHFIVNPMFALFPLQPPWMADSEVTRLVALHAAREIPDTNPLAAMPSLHVALPLLISLWLFRERWKLPALLMLAYAALVGFEVVLSGEHYVIDAAAGAAVAVAIMLAVEMSGRLSMSRHSGSQETASRGRSALGGRIPSGLTSQPGVILLLTGALIALVSVQAALAL